MTKIERVELLRSKRDYIYLFTLFILLFSISLFHEYYNYKELTKFNSQIIQAKVLKQYKKSKILKPKKVKNYQVLKLESTKGFTFYSIASKNLPNYKGRNIEIEIWAGDITFLSYLKNFFAFSKILKVYESDSLKESIIHFIDTAHTDRDITLLYQALFLAKPLPYHLQKILSDLGISHLIAISGFHLGVLSAILFFLIKSPYRFFQSRYFPYRHLKRDTFLMISILLLLYMLFLDTPPSLLRSFAMLLVGFILYDRGVKIVSMQTLLITFLLLIALFPRLLFSIGFFLSLSGVFYIFLFLIYFQNKKKLWQFLILPFWVYLMMLPYSLVLFGNFSLYHPFSIIITSLFTLFYPITIFLHFLGVGNLFDGLLEALLQIEPHAVKITLSHKILYLDILLSFVAIFKKEALYLLLVYNLSIFIYSIYHIT